jgi:uncharacterized protein (TIGR02996 family)
MTDEDAFLRAIQEQPGDVTNKLVYADWLEEQGDPLRAGYLRTWAIITDRPVGWVLTRNVYPDVEQISQTWLALLHGHVPIWDSTTTLAIGRLQGALSTYASLNDHASDISYTYEATLMRLGMSLPDLAARHFGENCSPVQLEPLADWDATLREVLGRWLFFALGTVRNAPQERLAFLEDRFRAYYIEIAVGHIDEVLRPIAGWQARITPTGSFYALNWDDLILEADDRVLFLHFSFSD